MTSTNKNYNKEFESRLGYKTEKLMQLFDHYSTERLKYERIWKVLDAFDNGKFWNYTGKVMPGYCIKPDTNWINYIKNSYVNSLYVGSYRGDVFCRKLKNEQTTLAINEFLEYIFNKTKIKDLQLSAGERASLLNFGATELGWNADIIDGVNSELFHGELEAKHIDNLSLFLDPSVTDYKKGQAIFIAEECTTAELVNEPRFKERMNLFIKEIKGKDTEYQTKLDRRAYGKGYYGQRSRSNKDDTLRLLTCYYKHYGEGIDGYRLDKVWILEDGFILNVQTNLKPKVFPVMVLYSNKPTKDPYGTPTTQLILNDVITVNLLDAIDSTMIYNSLERPKVVSRRSGINETLFAQQGNDPKKLWVVDGDPNNVVRYIDLPDIPADRMLLLKQRLEANIMRVSNIDDTYNGADTNSIQTTGGMDLLNQRITMRDNTRISLLQNYILDITEYIMMIYLENGGSNRKFPVYDKYHEVSDVKELNFEDMKKEHMKFDFTCDCTPNLPNNIQRRADIANVLMEKQMQYNFNPQLISAEEWLATQDFPNKYKILQRIRAERMRDDKQDLEADLVNYAGLVQQGMRPESAVDTLVSEKQFKRDNPASAIGNTQMKQMG